MAKLFKIKKSKIHGKGVFSNRKLFKNEVVGVGIKFFLYFYPIVTKNLGEWINHSSKPNTYLDYDKDENLWNIVMSKTVPKGTELAVDYTKTPIYIMGPEEHYV